MARCLAPVHLSAPNPPSSHSALSHPPPNGRKWLLAAAKLAVVALLVWGIRGTLTNAVWQIADYDAGDWTLRPGWLALAGGLYLLGLLPCGLFWRGTLARLGQKGGVWRTLRAYYIGHLGKYVPGKAMVVVLRTALVPKQAGSAGLVAVSVLYETLTMMASGALLATAILAVGYPDRWKLALLGLLLTLIAGLPTLPPVFRRLVRWARIGAADAATAERLRRLGWNWLAVGWVCTSLGWIAIGGSLWATLAAIGQSPAESAAALPLLIATAALALVAGFLSLIPGGVGVREFVLLELLFRQLGLSEATALVAAIVLRLVWLVAEVLVSAILYVAGWKKPAA